MKRTRRKTGWGIGVILGALLLVTAAHAESLQGLDRPVKVVDVKAAVASTVTSNTLPGHVVGVLQEDPAAQGPNHRYVLWAGGQLWPNLFVLVPTDRTPVDLPLDRSGNKLHLPCGVHAMQPNDLTIHPLPAVVEVTVNQGHGVAGSNVFLFSCKPVRPAVWHLPVPSLVSACLTDWSHLASSYVADEPFRDITVVQWQDRPSRLLVVVTRRQQNVVVKTPDRHDPRVLVRGRAMARMQYTIDASGNVLDKILSRSPVPPMPLQK